MAGGSFASDPSFDAFNQQVNPVMSSYFQTMGQLERSRQRLMQVSSGISQGMPSSFSVAQQGLMAANQQFLSPIGQGLSQFTSAASSAYSGYQGPIYGAHNFMGPGTLVGAATLGASPFIESRRFNESQYMARDAAWQAMRMGWQDVQRTALTQIAPSAMMMGGFMMGGPVGLGVAGAGALGTQVAPLILRQTGLDAELHGERFRRQIQLSIGERLGDRGGASRFRLARGEAAQAEAAVVDYVQGVQQQYGLFAPEARQFEPLIGAALDMTADKDLPRVLERGAEGLKNRIETLREASATLNMSFEEISQLAREFGQDTELGVGGRFDQFVQDINRAASGGGRGLNRRGLTQLAIQQRQQAIAMGFQGESAQRGVVQLARDIQTQANAGLIGRDYLFAYGGRTQAEAAMNAAAATQQMEFNMASGPFGQMALGRQTLGGGVGNLMTSAGRLGAAFTNDPLGFQLQQYDPGVRSRMGMEARYTMFQTMRNTFGDTDLFRLAFNRQLEAQGMTPAQAEFQFRTIGRDMAALSGQYGEMGFSEGDLVRAAMNARSMDPTFTPMRLAHQNLSRNQIESLIQGDASGVLAAGATRGMSTFQIRSEGEINRLVAARLGADPRFSGGAIRDYVARADEVGINWETLGRSIVGGYRSILDTLELTDVDEAYEAAFEEERGALMEQRREALRTNYATAGTEAYFSRNKDTLRFLGLIGQAGFEDMEGGIAQEVLTTFIGTSHRRDHPLYDFASPEERERLKRLGIAAQAINRGGFQGFQVGDTRMMADIVTNEGAQFFMEYMNQQMKADTFMGREAEKLGGIFEDERLTHEELTNKANRNQLVKFFEMMQGSRASTAVAQQTSLFSGLLGGSLSQIIMSAKAGTEDRAMAQLSKLRFEGDALMVSSGPGK